MMRPSVILTAMSMLAACGGLAYLHVTREPPAAAPARSNEPRPSTAMAAAETSATATAPSHPAAATSTDTAAQAAPPAEETNSNETTAVTPETVAQWIKDTQSTDAELRAAAIAALANAPKTLAMPALERVLETGEPNVDRHIALRSMHTLALRDGDANGQIRDVMRHAIYHGDDDGVTQTAQSLLDDIEAELTQRALEANETRER